MLSFVSLLSDTKNFIKNNAMKIFISLFALAIVIQLIVFLYYPDINAVLPLKRLIEQTTQQYGDQLSPDSVAQTLLSLSEPDRQQLITEMMTYLTKLSVIFFVVNLISMSAIITLIYSISYQQLSLKSFLYAISKFIPKIIAFMLLAIPGFICLSILASIVMPLAIPLMMLAIIFYLTLFIIFLAVLIEPTQRYRFMQKLKVSLSFFRRELKLIMPIVAAWFFSIYLLNAVANILITNMVISVIFKALELFFILFTLCYLYRLYSLSNKALAYDASN